MERYPLKLDNSNLEFDTSWGTSRGSADLNDADFRNPAASSSHDEASSSDLNRNSLGIKYLNLDNDINMNTVTSGTSLGGLQEKISQFASHLTEEEMRRFGEEGERLRVL